VPEPLNNKQGNQFSGTWEPMVSRNVLNHCVRIGSAIALLVAVTISPLGPVSGSLRSNFVRSDFARAPARPAVPLRVIPTSSASRPTSVKAVRSENEEEDLVGVIRPVSHFLAVPPSHSATPFRDFAPCGGIMLLFPLRC
jgi:hypothetical protein